MFWILRTSRVSLTMSSSARLYYKRVITFWFRSHARLWFSWFFLCRRGLFLLSICRLRIMFAIRKVWCTRCLGRQCNLSIVSYRIWQWGCMPDRKPLTGHHRLLLWLLWRNEARNIYHLIWSKCDQGSILSFLIRSHLQSIEQSLKLPLISELW